MRVVVVCNDTLGGVRPYAALALGLRRAGHDVVAVAPGAQAHLFAAADIPVTPLAGTTAAEVAAAATIAERGTVETLRYMARELPKRLGGWTRQTLKASGGADVLTGGIGGMIIGSSVAEALGIPFVEAHLQPMRLRTAQFPGLLLPWLPNWLGDGARRASHAVSDALIELPFQRAMSQVRREVLNLRGRALRSSGKPALYGFSPTVVPLSADETRGSVVTGYWDLVGEPAPPFADAVDTWLEGGGPRVAIGFGSMTASDIDAVCAMLDEAMTLIDARAVVGGMSGGSAPVAFSSRLLLVPPAPHHWLFPKVDCIVHHGGAGTTGAAFRAGRPQIVVPFAVDQPFWARRTVALGVSPGFVPRRALTADRLAGMLREALASDTLLSASRHVGSVVEQEDGVSRAVQAFGLVRSSPSGTLR